ncbi:MAG: type II toxin-antitoxin system prevent-host-death family antitoxin [Bifidobacteriaceae bacterium]|jgi:prevent-host-death family protein|nr:type II toxin-antitoxin system prevent-host-death family antitoxin [Bifidobacteriaceae bacterium]
MTKVGIYEARNNFSELIKRAKAGEDVVVVARGVPQVRLVPVDPPPGHGTGGAILKWLNSAGPVPGRAPEELDATIAAERAAWD